VAKSRLAWSLVLDLLTVLAVCASCGEQLSDPGFGPLPEYRTVALPFVEAVHVPAEIHAGQPFDVEFQLSCAQNPDALRSVARPFAPHDVVYGNGPTGSKIIDICLYRDPASAGSSAALVTSVTFTIQGRPAGQYVIYYGSSLNREQGGMPIVVKMIGHTPANSSESQLGQQSFTVLP
jgi:hypothetical protein